MEARAAAIADGSASELVWLLEHPPLYTAGSSAERSELLSPDRFPVFETGRGGRFTYHGPGQRVAYVMLDLRTRGRDVRAFVQSLEAWLIDALAMLGVRGETRSDRIGVWTRTPDDARFEEAKIAALGVRLRRWVSFHGVALNVAPDLSHFEGITPCGIDDPRFGVTSLHALGASTDVATVDAALRAAFETRIAPLNQAAPPLPAPVA